MVEVERYIDNLQSHQRTIALELHLLMLSFPDVTTKLRWKIPFYYRKSWLTYINPIKNGHIEFCFVRANELSNEAKILNFKKRKQIAGIEISEVHQIHTTELLLTIDEAIILDESVKYNVRKK